MGIIVKSDFSDVDGFFSAAMGEVRSKVEGIGRDSVAYAVANGDYQNVTGHLRRSNRYEADEQGLRLVNDAEYASDVESRGYEVLSGAALYAESRLKEEIG